MAKAPRARKFVEMQIRWLKKKSLLNTRDYFWLWQQIHQILLVSVTLFPLTQVIMRAFIQDAKDSASFLPAYGVPIGACW